MSVLKGITVLLHERVNAGTDPLGAVIWQETLVPVDNVLVRPYTPEAADTETRLDGKAGLYRLAIPKGDGHQWDDTLLEFFGQVWKTVGFSTVGIEEMIPLDWNRQVSVERYTGGQNNERV